MFNPENIDAILRFNDNDLTLLPDRETDIYEYKSSRTKDDDLSKKISVAASGFWNSGGGLFIAGVSDSGKPDGGISLNVVRQSRADWIDSVITSNVSPRGRYVVHFVVNENAGLDIKPDNAVILIGFACSEFGPHMAWDKRYYIRAGAHTYPASHFIIEAIYARRRLQSPLIRHVIKRKENVYNVIQVGIICLNDEPALSVKIQFEPIPKCLTRNKIKTPFYPPLISREMPFYFDLEYNSLGEAQDEKFEMKVEYVDIKRTEYCDTIAVDISKQIGSNFSGHGGIEDKLSEIAREIHTLVTFMNNR